jgi:hypothetical protein
MEDQCCPQPRGELLGEAGVFDFSVVGSVLLEEGKVDSVCAGTAA